MTELQLAIGHLKETISVGGVLLVSLETEQKNLEKQQEEAGKLKAPGFPFAFYARKDPKFPNNFMIGLDKPRKSKAFPSGVLSRRCYQRDELREIIKGLQTLLGDSQ